MNIIQLSCDDEWVILVGEKSVDIEHEVKEVLKSMSCDDVVDPINDWFLAIVDGFCNRTDYKPLEIESYNVETDYWTEVMNRSEE